MDRALSLLGLAQKAGKVESGEDAVDAATAAHKARLVLLSSEAAENSVRRAKRFAGQGDCLIAELPVSKARLGGAVGRGECAMLALTDLGFAEALAKRFAALDEARYGELAERLSVKKKRAEERKRKKSKELSQNKLCIMAQDKLSWARRRREAGCRPATDENAAQGNLDKPECARYFVTVPK